MKIVLYVMNTDSETETVFMCSEFGGSTHTGKNWC